MNFTSQDVIKIIREAAKSGVSKFELGDIKIEFVDKSSNVVQNLDKSNLTGHIDYDEAPKINLDQEDLETDEETNLLMIADSQRWEDEVIFGQTEEEAQSIGAASALD